MTTEPGIVLTYVVPSLGRPELQRLLESLRTQRDVNHEIIVVFDGVEATIDKSVAPNVRVLRLPSTKGQSVARNVGAREARGAAVAFVDDDDWLSPHHGVKTLKVLDGSGGCSIVVGGIAGYRTPGSKPVYTRLPPALSPQGSHWSLSSGVGWKSSLTKQSAVFRKDFFLAIGGFDETLRGREWTELFWRANESSCIRGIQETLYFRQVWGSDQKHLHRGGPGLRRWSNFQNLIASRPEIVKTHAKGFSRMLWHHEHQLRASGHPILARIARYRNALERAPDVEQCRCAND